MNTRPRVVVLERMPTSIKLVSAVLVLFSVTPAAPASAQHRGWRQQAWQPQQFQQRIALIDNVCVSAFGMRADEEECTRQASAIRGDAVTVVRACEDAFDGDTNELACVASRSSTPDTIANRRADARSCQSANTAVRVGTTG